MVTEAGGGSHDREGVRHRAVGQRPHVLDDGLLAPEGLPEGVARRVVRPVAHGDRPLHHGTDPLAHPLCGLGLLVPDRGEDCSKPTLQGIIRGRVDPRTVINSDGWRGYHGLVDLGYGHVRVDHARDEFTKGTAHINGIEGFWGLAKVRLTQFKGLPKHTFHLHLKETEWRYNHRRADKYKCLLQYLRKNPLS